MKDFDWFFNENARPTTGSIVPRVNISEDTNTIHIHAELPGVSQEDVKLTVNEGVLTLRGEKKKEEKFEERNYHRIERRYGEFVRQFTLPENVKLDEIKAEFKNGVLEVALPKTAPEEPKVREIPINVSLN
jgi:HSP20 family protein